jgi:hypothetical protein
MEQFLTLVLAAVGKTLGDPAVKALLDDQQIRERPALPEDDNSTYVERRERGYSLIWVEQPHVKNPAYRRPGRDVLVLVGCHFYDEGYQGYNQYGGELPNGLAFGDAREAALRKLGGSAWRYEKDGKVRRERWEFADTDRQLNLTYSPDERSIRLVYFGIREFFTV